MDESVHELIEKILHGVSFIAIGGAVAVIFFFIFAPSILGFKAIHKQLEKLQQQAEQIKEQLKKIAQHLEHGKENPQNKH